MLRKALKGLQRHLSPSSYLTAYWPKNKRKFVLGFQFIRRYLEGKLDVNVYLDDLEEFKSQLISKNGLAPFEFEMLKILISIEEYERILNSLDVESRKRAKDLMNPDSFYRDWAIEDLTKKEISQASPLIRQRLFESDEHIVEASIKAIAILEQQNSTPILRIMSYHPEFVVHTECARWLGENGSQRQDVYAVIQSLSKHISLDSLRALQRLNSKGVPGTEEAIPILEDYLKMPEFYKHYSGRFMGYMVPLARNTLYLISRRAEHNPLYSRHSTDKHFTDTGRNVVARREFIKEGGKTILLGGKQIGKAVIKIVSEESFSAWKKAFTSEGFWRSKGFEYVPVEPILGIKKTMKLRAKKYTAKVAEGEKERWYETQKGGETIYAVATRVLGPTLRGYEYRLEKSVRDRLIGDKNRIIGGITELGIEYAPEWRKHAHDDNFCLMFYKNTPRLYIIDFDHARLAA